MIKEGGYQWYCYKEGCEVIYVHYNKKGEITKIARESTPRKEIELYNLIGELEHD